MTHGKGSPIRKRQTPRRAKVRGGRTSRSGETGILVARGVRIRRPVASSRSKSPSKRRTRQAGPPKVGFRTIKGRGGRRITIKKPSPRIVGPTESQAIGKSPRRRVGRRIA